MHAERELVLQNIPQDRIVVTGNTVIDALLYTAGKKHTCCEPMLRQLDGKREKKLVLVTAHRRENLGRPMEHICRAMRELVTKRNDVQVLFPVHLNPQVRRTVNSLLAGVAGALLLEPLDYEEFIHSMKLADLVVTDSGGIQEEAPALGKPVLVMRTTTERPEAVEAGTAKLIGTNSDDIVSGIETLLDDRVEYASMQRSVSPFGDGHASARIVSDLRRRLGLPYENVIPGWSPLTEQKKLSSHEAFR
jgi:UDP-N-acetylglucosamine 2-epimerase (non-hydrolysing)